LVKFCANDDSYSKLFGELKATAEGKEELALGSEEIEKLK